MTERRSQALENALEAGLSEIADAIAWLKSGEAMMGFRTEKSVAVLLDAHASALRDAERLREALKRITAIEDCYSGTDWQEIEEAREIARSALDDNTKGAAE